MRHFLKSQPNIKKQYEYLCYRENERQEHEYIDNLLLFFDKYRLYYEIILNDLTARDWMLNSYPFFWWGKIDVEKVSHHHVVTFYNLNHDSYIDFFEPFINKNTRTSEFVYIIWFDDSRPIIKMRFLDVIKYIDNLLDEGWNTWVVCPEDGWCIEHHHIGELSLCLLETYE